MNKIDLMAMSLCHMSTPEIMNAVEGDFTPPPNYEVGVENAFQIFEELDNQGISYVHVYDEDYPEQLKDLKDPPTFLCYKGILPKKRLISCVGTRKPTAWANEVTKRLCSFIVKKDIQVVSGLALGVDTVAHKAALNNTVAVLPCSLDVVYPKSNASLVQEILDNGGCVLSEYKIKVGPNKSRFLARNRIVAALGESLVVTECGLHSGTMNTVQHALRLGKPIYVPANQRDLKECDGGRFLLEKTGGELSQALNPDRDVKKKLLGEYMNRPVAIKLARGEGLDQLLGV